MAWRYQRGGSVSGRVSRSVVSDSAVPWTVAHQAPLSMEFSRQKYSGGLPFPSPGYLPNPGFKPRSLAWPANSLPSEPSIIHKVVENCLGIINPKLRIQNIYHSHYTQMSYMFSERRDGPLMKPPL